LSLLSQVVRRRGVARRGAWPGRRACWCASGPDGLQPRSPQDPHGLRVAFAPDRRVGVEGGRPWRAVAGVVGEDVKRLAGLVGGQAEVRAAGLARCMGNRGGAGLGGGVLGAAGAVQDRAELGEGLGVADLAHPRQPGQQVGLRVLAEPRGHGLVKLGDGGQQSAQQLHLGADDLAEHAGSSPAGGRGAEWRRWRSWAARRPPR
jgi:hypothetical protein